MRNRSGITLIALIITVIVMLILAGVALSAISGDAGLFGRVQKTAELYNNQSKQEASTVNAIIDEINKSYNNAVGDRGGNNDEDIEVTVKIGEETETLTEENVKDYLGKKVTNFKEEGADNTETVKIGDEGSGEEYIVSTTYRLYYVDFDGKYGVKNTIYLKADCTSNNYQLPITDTTLADNVDVKIKDLNPGLYYEESKEEIPFPDKNSKITSPDIGNENMKKVTWLTNTKNWQGLKNTVNDKIQKSINYIVGAPSLEMMIDSYNTHYGLSGETPDTTTTETELQDNKGKRVKLFYKYPYNGNNYGYGVGPSDFSSAIEKYYYYTRSYSVKTDSIDSMYYPGSGKFYWLASPSAYSAVNVINVGQRRWRSCG